MIRLHPIAERTLVAIFLMALCLPLAGMVLRLDHDPPSAENRTLAPRPQLRWDTASLRSLPEQWTRYFEDHFAFRQRLVRWQAIVRLNALRVSPSDAVIRGRDGWLFYADDGAMEDYAEALPFTDAELEAWRQTLQDTSDWLRAQGIAYLFVVSPDKHVIYQEYMPATIRRAEVSRIEQLVSHLRAHSTVRVLDLRPALLAAKAHERIYHRTDTHWNDRGAFVGYQQIVEALAADVPALPPPSRSAFEPRVVRSAGLDLAGMLGLTTVLDEDDLVLVPRRPGTARILEPHDPNPRLMHPRIVTEAQHRGPRAVVFMDSFGAGLVRFLSEDFSRVVYLWQNNMDPQVVRQERPQVVIQEWVGRRLATQPPYNPVPEMSARSGRP
jgi:alginate O-acetyltransferase complex protein AlgJ